METIKTRGSEDIHSLDDIYHRFSAYRGLGREPEVLIDDVRAWRKRRAEAAMEKRELFCSLLEEVQNEALRRKMWESVHEKMETVLEKPIPRVSADSCFAKMVDGWQGLRRLPASGGQRSSPTKGAFRPKQSLTYEV